MSDMLDFSLGLIQGVVSLMSEGPLLYLFGFVLFAVVVKAWLSILDFGVGNK